MASTDTASSARRGTSRSGVFGVTILLVILLGSLLSIPWTFGVIDSGGIPTRRYEAANLQLALFPPVWWHTSEHQEAMLQAQLDSGAYVPGRILGTDRLGRDFFARCLAGGGISLAIGFCAALLSVVIGTLYGAVAGWAGGRLDALLMRLVDILFGLPYILLVVLLSVAVDGYLQSQAGQMGEAGRQFVNVLTLLAAIGAVSWLAMARVIRGQVLSLREQPFMEASRAVGVPLKRQFLRHLLPNLMGPIIVYATLAVPAAILSESFLSFLGIGVKDPLPSWGNLASSGLSELNTVRSHWWLLFWPCLLIGTSLLALNFVGDHLKERFDPIRASV